MPVQILFFKTRILSDWFSCACMVAWFIQSWFSISLVKFIWKMLTRFNMNSQRKKDFFLYCLLQRQTTVSTIRRIIYGMDILFLVYSHFVKVDGITFHVPWFWPVTRDTVSRHWINEGKLYVNKCHGDVALTQKYKWKGDKGRNN